MTDGAFFGHGRAQSRLAIIVIPVVVRTTEDMLLLVPNALREAAAALGLPRAYIVQTDRLSRGERRHHHRHSACDCARQRRNRAAALHGAQQSVLEHQPERSDGKPSRVIFQFALSPYERLAEAGVDWRAAHHAGRTCPEHSCPRPFILEKYLMNILATSQAVPLSSMRRRSITQSLDTEDFDPRPQLLLRRRRTR